MSPRDNGQPAIASLADLDRLVHEPARLAILLHLYAAEEADFLYVMRQTGLSQGNLSSHISKLEAAGYIEVNKTFQGKMPRTLLRLTQHGRKALTEYGETIVRVLSNCKLRN